MFIIKEYSMAIKLEEVNKILYYYDIKNYQQILNDKKWYSIVNF